MVPYRPRQVQNAEKNARETLGRKREDGTLSAEMVVSNGRSSEYKRVCNRKRKVKAKRDREKGDDAFTCEIARTSGVCSYDEHYRELVNFLALEKERKRAKNNGWRLTHPQYHRHQSD
jgi:hypothetical protein